MIKCNYIHIFIYIHMTRFLKKVTLLKGKFIIIIKNQPLLNNYCIFAISKYHPYQNY
jgi:hypothetical protein